jgi:hypothetical protein
MAVMATKNTKAQGKAKKPARRAWGSTPGAKTQAATNDHDVARRWQEYWKCRKDLEEAVAAVRSAEQELTTARELERTRRELFDRTKNSLKELLEVEPASARAGSGKKTLEFPLAEPKGADTSEKLPAPR